MYIKQQYDKIKLGKKEITLKNNQTIIENINRIINHIQNNKILATKGKRHFGLKHIKEINNILVNPLDIISTRPTQKSYPNINGLYLILRAMGIIQFKFSKKEIVMQIDKELLKNWQSLNETEQYFMLLEFWLFHSSPRELLNAFYQKPIVELKKFFTQECFSFNQTILALDYNPEYHNLALCEMFGFIKIKTQKPKDKNHWNIIDIKVQRLGKKILALIISKYEDIIKSDYIYSSPKLGFSKEVFQPHFKEFKNVLEYPKEKEPIIGVYRLKISFGRVYRIIEISSDKNFEFLALAILEQFNFDNDHLYEFSFTNNLGIDITIGHAMVDGADLWVDEYKIKELPLQVFESFKFIFDFGDWWEFDILIEKIKEGETVDEVKLIKSYGTAPEQYPDYDEEW